MRSDLLDLADDTAPVLGLSDKELRAFARALEGIEGAEERPPEPPVVPASQSGDLWILGDGIVTKQGKPIDKKYLYRLLSNRIYIGEITHKGDSYPGQHDAIIDREIWDRPAGLPKPSGALQKPTKWTPECWPEWGSRYNWYRPSPCPNMWLSCRNCWCSGARSSRIERRPGLG